MKDIIELAHEIHEKNRKRFGDSGTCADKAREEITEALLAEENMSIQDRKREIDKNVPI